MTEHYLDNSATTKVSEAAAKAAFEVMTENYGNPSSLHSKGIAAERVLEEARETVAEALNADSREIFFTSGGTESNNTAIFGAANAKKRLGNKIVTTAIEHSSVIEAVRALEKQGFETVYIQPDGNGHIPAERFENAIDEKTILVSAMAVNNEIGTVLPVDFIPNIIKNKKSPALFHIDAVQAFGKLDLDSKKLRADLISVSSHKIHGPKGAGALYIRRGLNLPPLIFGGEQERKIRPGTEPLPAIAGFAAAVAEFNLSENLSKVRALNGYLCEKLSSVPEVIKNSPDDALDYILNFSVVGIRSETMLHFLAQKGIYVSSGSACAKGKKSHILQAIGLDESRADSALRISFSKYNTFEDCDALANGIKDGIKSLVRKVK